MATTPEKTMDLAQVSHRLAWLDDERRKDHAELARLAQELASVLAMVKDQSGKVREAGDRLGALEAAVSRFSKLDDAIMSTRAELVPLREADGRLGEDIQRQSRDHKAYAEQQARLMADLSGRIDGLMRSIDALAARLTPLENQRQVQADRLGELALRVEGVYKLADTLEGRLKVGATRQQEVEARLLEMAARLESVIKASESLDGRLKLLAAREQEHTSRLGELAAQIASVGTIADAADKRLKVLETREQEHTRRLGELAVHVEGTRKMTETVEGQVKVLEQREAEHVERNASLHAQMLRLETAFSAATEEAKRATARVDSFVVEIQQLAKLLAQAQEADNERHRQHDAALAEQKETVAGFQRLVEDVSGSIGGLASQLEHLSEAVSSYAQTTHRLDMAVERLDVLDVAFKGFQETESTRWGTEIPEIRNLVEEASTACQANSAAVQEAVAGVQALKEEVRRLAEALHEERTHSEELATSLRLVVEEDIQDRLLTAQKQLRNLQRLAKAPAESNERT